MACCFRQRRTKSEPLPDSQEFKVLTPDHLEEVREIIKERSKREKENQRKRKLARELRKRFEAGEATEADHENADRLSRYSMDRESIDAEEAAKNEEDAKKDKENKRLEKKGANKRMEAGKKLSPKYVADFQKHLVGQPLIDIDPFYKEKEVFIVVGKDHTIFRFSAHNGLFCLSPFNPIRRLALYTLVHPLFNIIVILTIITNCVFMAKGGEENAVVEYIFTAIYTFEFLIKMLARGLILAPFTYLRDAWNWLDFLVIMLAYVMLVVDKFGGENGSAALGNVSALRTFRVLRALKTVAVVPGLKTIVGALMEAVIKMRDVGILTVFMLSIFALVGLQLYMGKLNHKCVRNFPPNMTSEEQEVWKNNEANWYGANDTNFNPDHLICGEGMGAGQCDTDAGFVCMPSVGKNPNFGYTSWDDFGSCMLNSFRIMTQDFWENIYFITIRANGTLHFFFFFFSILLGSFYLINLILAIVAMAYNDQQERDRSELQAEADEKQESDEAEAQKAADAAEDKEEQNRQKREACIQARKASAPSRVPSLEKLLTPKSFKAYDRVSLKTDFDMDDADANKQQSLSLPSSPVPRHRTNSVHAVMLAIHHEGITGQLTGPIIERKSKPRPSLDTPGLGIDNPLPYADDSQAVTPSSVDGPLMFDYSNLENNGAVHHFSRGLRASLNSRASVRSRSSQRAPPNSLPSRAMHNSLTDEQNNIPAVIVNGPSKQQTIEGEMLPENEIPNQYCSLTSLDTNAALKYNINMKGVDDIRGMADIASRARTIDEQNVSKKELWKARLRQLFCSWSCCPCFLTIQKYLDLFINDAFMEVFIMICILCNTSFMAMEHYGQPKSLDVVTKYGNYVFTAVFTMESMLKLLALGPFKFFREAWNSFDFAVVSFSLFELYQELASNSGAGGLSVLRSFRLLRVLKLAKSWKTLNSLMMIVAKSLGALGNLTVVLGIIIFIFAVMGTQLFAEKYKDESATFTEEAIAIPEEGISMTHRIPRWNFKDFLHALMIVFRVLCGEWIESMWNCMRTGQEYLCIPFFLLTMVIGNLIVLNLFLVLLLSSFSADALDNKDDDDEVDKITEAKGRIMRFFKYVKKSVRAKCCGWRKGKSAANSIALPGEMVAIKSAGNGTNGALIKYKDSLGDESDGLSNSKTVTMIPLLSGYDEPIEEKESSLEKIGQFSTSSSCESLDDAEALVPKLDGDPLNPDLTEVEDDEGVPEGYNPTLVEYETLPSPCCFPIVIEKFGDVPESPLVKKFWALRCFAYRLVEHKYFEGFIIICILLSSMSLALEDVYLKDRYVLKLILNYMDKIFSGIFICEMLIKWLAFGFHKYFTNAWCWLDFIIVGISIAGLIMESSNSANMSAFKAMRTLRALRPLRAVSRWEGMRVVVNALIQAVPSISNVLLVILIFWLIFAIMGVNFFGGKFFKCVNNDSEPLHVKYRLLNASHFNHTPLGEDEAFDYTKHVLGVKDEATCEAKGYKWQNSRINFDNVLRAYLALLQVATYKGWIEIMADATDITDNGLNPVFENRPMFYIYFVMFIIFGGFFTLNLFIGVIIENFNAQKKKAGGSLEMFMTDDQKKYYNAMKKLSASGPAKATPRPKWGPQALIFDFTINQKFDVAIMIFILLNMLTMCAEHSNQSAEFSEILVYVNIVFIVVFTLEAVLKLIALRHHYFKFPWNVFDFVVVLFSILGLAFQDSIEKYLDLSPTVLRVVRVFRVGRVLRLVKSAKGIRTLLFSLLVSLPALFNIGLLLFLVIFIYATFGMAFFGKVKQSAGIDSVFNFETFFQALITLFQCTTSAGWSGVYAAITNEDDCEELPDGTSNCGNEQLGTVYMVSYLLFTFLVIINMYIAVILENFSQATEDVQQGITQDDIEMYYELWSTYDPKATKYIPVDKLFDLVDELEDPLRVAKPNYFRLVMTDIPVCEGDKIHCSDILDMLTRIFLNQETGLDPTTEDPNADNNMPQADVKEKYGDDYKPIYGLLERQRHKWAARFIWRRYLAYRAAKDNSVGSSFTRPVNVTIENELQAPNALSSKKDKKAKRSTSKTDMGGKS